MCAVFIIQNTFFASNARRELVGKMSICVFLYPENDSKTVCWSFHSVTYYDPSIEARGHIFSVTIYLI